VTTEVAEQPNGEPSDAGTTARISQVVELVVLFVVASARLPGAAVVPIP